MPNISWSGTDTRDLSNLINEMKLEFTCDTCKKSFYVPLLTFRPDEITTSWDGEHLTVGVKFIGAALCSECHPPNGMVAIKKGDGK
jgi:hypothetical protein